MISIYSGDRSEAKKAIRTEVSRFRKTHPTGNITRVDEENLSAALLADLYGGVSLFGEPMMIVIDGDLSKDQEDVVISLLSQAAKSLHTVFWYQEKALKALKDAAAKEKILLKDFPKKEKFEFQNNNVFAMADAFIDRDKRTAWARLVEVFRAGASAEEVHGTLSWAVKSTILSIKTSSKDAAEVGVKPNVYSKYARMGKKWSTQELSLILTDLRSMYHDAHRGKCDLETTLERLVLSQK